MARTIGLFARLGNGTRYLEIELTGNTLNAEVWRPANVALQRRCS